MKTNKSWQYLEHYEILKSVWKTLGIVWNKIGISFRQLWDKIGKIYLNLDIKCDITKKFIEYFQEF